MNQKNDVGGDDFMELGDSNLVPVPGGFYDTETKELITYEMLKEEAESLEDTEES